jgi:hypothetical protein
MHPQDILKYGHSFVMRTLDGFPAAHYDEPGAVGYWSAKDVIAHLGSYELALVELLASLLTPCPTPLLDQMNADGQAFNDQQVDVLRKGMSMRQVLDEYESARAEVLDLAGTLPAEMWRETGLLSWYGAEYDLEDFIVYTYYGHKREHCGQLQTFSDHFK